jgi:hypothetical protein
VIGLGDPRAPQGLQGRKVLLVQQVRSVQRDPLALKDLLDLKAPPGLRGLLEIPSKVKRPPGLAASFISHESRSLRP